MRPNSLEYIWIENFPKQSFSEHSLKRDGAIFYTDSSIDWFEDEDRILFEGFINIDSKITELRNELSLKATSGDINAIGEITKRIGKLDKEKEELINHLFFIDAESFKTPMNMVYVSHRPEIEFVQSLFNHIDLLDCFIKSAEIKDFIRSLILISLKLQLRHTLSNLTLTQTFS
jgi:hypothetical protein